MKTLIILFLTIASTANAQTIKLDPSTGGTERILHLKGEDQHGNEIEFAPPEENPLLVIFLPKAESRDDAESMMDEATAWFERLNKSSGVSITKILVVEPYRTGAIVNRLFRSKLRDKPFPVIRDPDGEMIRLVHREGNSSLLWLTDREGNILYESFEPFSEPEFQKVARLAGTVMEHNDNPQK